MYMKLRLPHCYEIFEAIEYQDKKDYNKRMNFCKKRLVKRNKKVFLTRFFAMREFKKRFGYRKEFTIHKESEFNKLIDSDGAFRVIARCNYEEYIMGKDDNVCYVKHVASLSEHLGWSGCITKFTNICQDYKNPEFEFYKMIRV